MRISNKSNFGKSTIVGVTEVGAGVCKPARPHKNATKKTISDQKSVIFPANFDVISSIDLEAATGEDDF